MLTKGLVIGIFRPSGAYNVTRAAENRFEKAEAA